MGNNSRRLFITGQGLLSPPGRGPQALAYPGNRVNSFSKRCPLEINDHQAGEELSKYGWRATLLALAGARQALQEAFPGEEPVPPETGVIIGTSLLDLGALENLLQAFQQFGPRAIPPWALHFGLPLAHASHLAVSLGLEGGCETFNDPVTAGINALGMAYRAWRGGEGEYFLAGGVEAPGPGIFQNYLTRVLPIRPGEGCAVFFLAGEARALSFPRGAGLICGYENAFTGNKKELKERLVEEVLQSSFPDGRGIDLLLETGRLPPPYREAMAGGSALACGLAIALLDQPLPAWMNYGSQIFYRSRGREMVERVVVLAEGPAGDSAAIALQSTGEAAQAKRTFYPAASLISEKKVPSSYRGKKVSGRDSRSNTFRPAAITGMGITSAFGVGQAAFIQGLQEGKSGITHYMPPGLENAGPATAALVPGLLTDPHLPRSQKLLLAAVEEALLDAGLKSESQGKNDRESPERGKDCRAPGNYRLGLYLAETLPALEDFQELASRIDRKDLTPPASTPKKMTPVGLNNSALEMASFLGTTGPLLTFASGCTGGIMALGRGARDVAGEGSPILLAGGADSSLFPFALGVLSRAKLLTSCPDPTRAGRPFDVNRSGEVTGEGSAIFVLENPEVAARRGATPRALITGFGAAGDGFHFKFNRPDGRALLKAARLALQAAGLVPQDLDLVIAHASGFKGSDAMEVKGLADLFAGCNKLPPVISIKGATGQPFAVGGLMQVAAGLMALETGIIPPTAHFQEADEGDPFDHVLEARPAEKPLQHILITSYGYGGGKAALILSGGEG